MKAPVRWRAPSVRLSYRETLIGAYSLPSEPHRQRPIVVSLTVGAPSVVELFRSLAVDVSGPLVAENLAHEASAHGTIRLAREGLSARIAYDLAFVSDEGEPLALHAEKRFDHRDPYTSLTVMAGAIADAEGVLRASCLLRFDARSDLGNYLKSFRLSIGRS